MIKLLIGGSPCTYWSVCRAGTLSPITRETKNEGLGWDLFLNYVIARQKFEPNLFLYENVHSMSNDIRESITVQLGVEPTTINGALVSAAERERDFWTNIAITEMPEDRGLVLGDILEKWVPEKYFYTCDFDFNGLDKPVCATLHISGNDILKRVNSPKFKCHTLTTCSGGNTQKRSMTMEDAESSRLWNMSVA